jgi:hypothetical protein
MDRQVSTGAVFESRLHQVTREFVEMPIAAIATPSAVPLSTATLAVTPSHSLRCRQLLPPAQMPITRRECRRSKVRPRRRPAAGEIAEGIATNYQGRRESPSKTTQ